MGIIYPKLYNNGVNSDGKNHDGSFKFCWFNEKYFGKITQLADYFAAGYAQAVMQLI